MYTNYGSLKHFIIQKGKKLFGDDFKYESQDYTWEESCWMREVLGEESKHEIDLMRITIKNVWKTHSEDDMDVETIMYLMETVEGPELVCNMLGFLQEEDMEKLREYPDCRFGERNNRLGLRAQYKTFAGTWHRIHYFRTKSCECAGVFLDAIARYKCSNVYNGAKKTDGSEIMEHTEFIAAVWQQIYSNFNEGSKYPLKTEFYPSFDTTDNLYYDNILIWLDEEYWVQIHRHPEYQEVVCEEPVNLWMNRAYLAKSSAIRKKHIDKLKELETDFIKSMIQADSQSVILAPPSALIPFIHVGEVRVTSSEASKVLFEKLKENKNVIENMECQNEREELDELGRQRVKDFY